MLGSKERCPTCRTKNSKKADFCSTCGQPSLSSWRHCTSCGAACGKDKSFCWSCRAPLDEQTSGDAVKGRWIRKPGDFATRITIWNVDHTFAHTIEVQEGTLAAVYRNGQFKECLDPGLEVFDNIVKRFFGGEKPKGENLEVVLIDSRTADIPFPLSKVTTKGGMQVDFEVRLLFSIGDPRAFARHYLNRGNLFTEQGFVDDFLPDVEQVVGSLMTDEDAFEVFKDLQLRERIESALLPQIAKFLPERGIEITGVRFARPGGTQFEQFQALKGQVAATSLEIDLERELADLERSRQLGDFGGELELEEAKKQRLARYNLAEADRNKAARLWEIDTEADLADQQARRAGQSRGIARDGEVDELQHQEGIATAKIHGDIARQGSVADAQREQARKDQELHLETLKAKSNLSMENLKTIQEMQQEKREAQHLQDLQREQHKADLLAQELRDRSGASDLANIATVTADKGATMAWLEGLKTGNVTGHGVTPPGIEPAAPTVYLHPGFQGAPSGSSLPPIPMTPAQVPSQWIPTQAQNPPGAWGAASASGRTARDLVGLVARQSVGGKVTPIGTAWCLRENIAVTNAHVAQEAQKLDQEPDSEILLILPGEADGLAFRVVTFHVHPDYRPAPDTEHTPEELGYHINDIALLIVDRELPGGLTIAGESALQQLDQGTPISTLGFPMEDILGGGVNTKRPQPIYKDGKIAAITGWDFSRTSYDESRLIHHDMGIAGGASGSPVLDASGQVIGIIWGGNMHHRVISAGEQATEENPDLKAKRISHGAVLNYAMRIDILEGLLKR